MPIVTDGPMLEPENKGIDQFHVGMGASLGATVSETLSDLPVAQVYRLNTPAADMASVPSLPQSDALGNALPSDGPSISEDVKPAVQRVDMIEAIDRVKKAGLAPHLTLPNQPDISPAQLDIMIQRARERREREVTMERGPQGFIPSTLQVGTSFLVGAIDPINLASAFVPVMGELRYGKMLATAGEGLASRLAVRASVGAAEGAVGQAALEPLDWWSHTQDGRDFGMADVLHNVMFGAVLGGALHGTGGAVSDAWRRRAGKPVYPFGPGEIMDGMQGGTHVPSRLLSDDGITTEVLEQHFTGDALNPRAIDRTPEANTPIFHETPDRPVTPSMLSEEVAAARPLEPSAPIQIIDDLPPRAKEDAMRAGIASLIDGEPLRVGEMLEAAARTDPRIAESFEMPIRADARVMPEVVRSGAFTIETTPIAGKILYHETSPERAAAMLMDDMTNSVDRARVSNIFLADNPDIAIGQGGKGVRLEFDGDLVSGGEHSKPATGDVTGREYQANAIANNALRGITLAPGQALELKPSWQARFDTLFEKRVLSDGTTRFIARDIRRDDMARQAGRPGVSVTDALDRDASWRALAQAIPEFDSPDIVAASKAADKVQTPKTGLSERVTASEKADAYSKQMYDVFAHRIPEEDRQRLDDLIKRIDDDNEAREIAIVRGGSCLFGVV